MSGRASKVRLLRRLTLEDRRRASDGAGGFSESWTALGQLWADVRMERARVSGRGAAALMRQPVRIIVRAAPLGAPSRPKPGQRFREGTRVFDVRAVGDLDGSGRYLACLAQEETAL